MLAAEPYPGAVETIRAWHEAGHFIHITSHRATDCQPWTAAWLDRIGLRLRRALLLVRQDHPLRGDRHRPARGRLPAQPRARARRRHARGDAAAPLEPRDLRDRGRRLRRATGTSSPAGWSPCWHDPPRAPARRAVARPARPPARDRAGAHGHGLGPLRAHRAAARQDALLVPLPLLVPLRGRGDRERPGHRRRADRRQPRRGASARRVDDRQGDPGGARRARGKLHLTVEHFFKGYPFFSMFVAKIGGVPAHPANVQRLLHDEQQLVLVFPEGAKATAKLYKDRYKLRRFGRGGFVAAAVKAGRADRPRRARRRRGGDAHVRPGRPAQAAHGPHLLPGHAAVPALRAARREPTCRRSSSCASSSPCAPTGSRTRTRASSRTWRTTSAPHPGRARRHARPPQVRLDGLRRRMSGRRVLITGLSTYWGGRLAQTLERDPDTEVIVGVSPGDPTCELTRTEYVRVGTQHALLDPHRRGREDRHGDRHAADRRLDHGRAAARRTRTTSSGR